MKLNRKDFIKSIGLGGLGLLAPSVQAAASKKNNTIQDHQLRIGLASYTLRKYSLDELLDIMWRLNLTDVSFKSFHLPYEAKPQELKFAFDKVKARGINLYGGGVIYFKKPEEVDQYFEYAVAAGLPMIIGAPEHHLLPQIEKKVKETNVKLAIHNHGPEDGIFPSPESVYEKIKDLDERIGLCIDMGHTFRLGLDPAEEVKKYAHRTYDIHIKDIHEQKPEGKNVIIGRGKMDIPAILTALQEIKYSGVVAIEYEKDPEHAIFGLAESVGFLRGILKSS